MHDHKIALIDIGSNTIRLVIYGINAYCDMDELLNLKTPARLSQYLDQTKSGEVTLSPQGILSLIHISEPTRRLRGSRMPSSA